MLSDAGDKLNVFAKRLRTPLTPSELSPHQILGRLARAQKQTDIASYELKGAEQWSRNRYDSTARALKELSERLPSIGRIPESIWRGVRCDPPDPIERERIKQKIIALQRHLSNASISATIATQLLDAPNPITIGDLSHSLAFIESLRVPAAIDFASLSHAAWRTDVDAIDRLVSAGLSRAVAFDGIGSIYNDVGTSADLSNIRMSLATKGASIFRVFSKHYREKIRELQSYLKDPLPKGLPERLKIVDSQIAARKANQDFNEAKALGAVFGRLWKQENSDWGALRAVVTWRRAHNHLPPDTWQKISKIPEFDTLRTLPDRMTTAIGGASSILNELIKDLDLDLRRAFNAESPQKIELEQLTARTRAWIEGLEEISKFAAFAAQGRLLANEGVGALIDAIHDGKLTEETLGVALENSYANYLRSALFTAWPELKVFDGENHNNQIRHFRKLDQMRIELAKEQLASKHMEDRPRGAAGIGPVGILNAEIARKRGHMPIRQLLEKAGPAIQQLKPVFMMSPLSVAQFLRPGGIKFDLLVMDEASQIEPVDALGAVARAQQLVVVGDERQLPPTAFFRKLAGEDDIEENDEDVTIQAKDAESILELCLAKGAPYRMLTWHYRSKHQSLIAVSNREFYENKLFIVPSPYDAVAGMGLKFNFMHDAPYERGETRTNPSEAKRVAQAVMQHVKNSPQLSLGVATFSVAQRQVILKELEILRRGEPSLESFFGGESTEPFFVKNLENIQGDERDVIFISVGYGKTAEGYLAHAFGPLSGDGGERRLNVLISRAKLRCEVFCNFTGADIDLDRTRAKGVAALKLFLTFAETGTFGLGQPTGLDHDSDFENQVATRLRMLGHDVKAQIGASGFRVDLAIVDPEKPGRFVLGIECDGAQYHSSRSARDRDRLRQQVLEAHGWIIHRVWSADWYLRPNEELKKIEEALSRARLEWQAREEERRVETHKTTLSFDSYSTDDTEVVVAALQEQGLDEKVDDFTPYREASFIIRRSDEPHEAPIAEVVAYVIKVVEVEGPIHVDEITTRIRTLWGLGRAGARIRGVIARAAEIATKQRMIEGGPFFLIPSRSIEVRDRSAVTSQSLRKPEMLPPAEIDLAIIKAVGENFGAQRHELIQAVSRSFGFAATSGQLRAVFEDSINRLLKADALALRDDLLVLPAKT
jgi:very-short-patch-repair endonuclease